ncbi:MAG: UPF0175 family protein [Chloroflexi bacterium]|nr:UPF0175 family protein [Chloroflexota bacterium]
MSIQLTIELPEDVFSALRSTPNRFGAEMRLAAAVKWCEMGRISQGKAAEIAGLSRSDFIQSLAGFNVSPFQITPEELSEDAKRHR